MLLKTFSISADTRHVFNPRTFTGPFKPPSLWERVSGVALLILFTVFTAGIATAFYLYWAHKKAVWIREGIKELPDMEDMVNKVLDVVEDVLPKAAFVEEDFISAKKIAVREPDPQEELVRYQENFGPKYYGLVKLQRIIEESGIEGVLIPTPQGLSSHVVLEFLQEEVPEIFEKWNALQIQYAEYCSQPENNEYDTSFLKQEAVSNALKEIQGAIKGAFSSETSLLNPYVEWLQELQERGVYLMVRSSGDEDTEEVANAGGNVSDTYVKPELSAVLESCGNVVASFFGELSLKNRLAGKTNPFLSLPMLSVVIQELIGEDPFKENFDLESIPISLVLFSTEPNYSSKDFSVMTISSTFGHGEGVVGNGVRCDTVYLAQSAKNPEQRAITYKNHKKTKRLAPRLNEEGKVQLTSVNNPETLKNQPSMSQEVLGRLVELGSVVEEAFGYPVDMEIVIKEGVIYPVQVRSVNRPEKNPTYFDAAALSLSIKSISVTDTFTPKTVVPGKGGVVVVEEKKEILVIEGDLAEAELLFNEELHKIVIVGVDEESLNSHPVINFSSLGVLCFFESDIEKLQQRISKMCREKLVGCPQTGRLYFWDWHRGYSGVEEFIKRGEVSHPAHMEVSFSTRHTFPEVAFNSNVTLPKEIKEAIELMRLAKEGTVALSAIESLQEHSFIHALSTISTSLEGRIKTMETVPAYVQEGMDLLNELEERLQETFEELKSCILLKKCKLQLLYSFKHLTALLSQEYGVANTFSLLQVFPLVKNITEALAYGSGDAPQVFVQLLGFKEYILDETQHAAWELFLKKLEENVQAGCIPEEKAKQFKEAIHALEGRGVLSTWLNLIFAQEWSESFPEVVILENLLQSLQGADQKILERWALYKERLEGIKEGRESFASPSSFEDAWATLQALIQNFKDRELYRGSKLTRLVASESMKELVEVIDLSIKEMKKSSDNYTEQETVEYLYRMVEENFALTKFWAKRVIGKQAILNRTKYKEISLDRYFSWAKKALTQKGSLKSLLSPSKGFSVHAATLCSNVTYERHKPSTLDDLFTLTHQNQLVLLSIFQLETTPIRTLQHSFLPPTLLEKLSLKNHFGTDWAEMFRDESSYLTGLTIEKNKVSLHYNHALRNHSMAFRYIYDRHENSLSYDVKFFGEARDRWNDFKEHLDIFEVAGIVSFKKKSKVTPQEISYILSLDSQEAFDRALHISGAFAFISMERCSYIAYDYLGRFLHEQCPDLVSLGKWFLENPTNMDSLFSKNLINIPLAAYLQSEQGEEFLRELQLLNHEMLTSDQNVCLEKLKLLFRVLKGFKYKGSFGNQSTKAYDWKQYKKERKYNEALFVPQVIQAVEMYKRVIEIVASLGSRFMETKEGICVTLEIFKVLSENITLTYQEAKDCAGQLLDREDLEYRCAAIKILGYYCDDYLSSPENMIGDEIVCARKILGHEKVELEIYSEAIKLFKNLHQVDENPYQEEIELLVITFIDRCFELNDASIYKKLADFFNDEALEKKPFVVRAVQYIEKCQEFDPSSSYVWERDLEEIQENLQKAIAKS